MYLSTKEGAPENVKTSNFDKNLDVPAGAVK